MKRELIELTRNIYDLLIIGGGIYGACVAWEATLRGLSVALVEKADFGSATSANSLKIIHGGLRYLQHADFRRMRESIRERSALMRIAHHLVHPLPVLIPSYGHGLQGKEILAIALLINDLISFDRNRLDDPEKHIPRGRNLSKRQVLQTLPDIHQQGLTGGAIFYDAQVYNSERLLLSFLRSAGKAGASLANYVKVTGFLRNGRCVIGVEAEDMLTGSQFAIKAKTVVNTCGPWMDCVLDLLSEHRLARKVSFAKAINIVTRPLFQTYAVGIAGRGEYRDTDAVVNKGNRFFFITPWRGRSLIGTTYTVYQGDPDDFRVTEQDVQSLLDEINQAYPSANLKREEVSFVHGGLLPSSGICRKTGKIQLFKHCQIHDHRHQGVSGLISVTGVKYTTARHVAEKVVDRVFESWEQKSPKSVSSIIPLYGGKIEQFNAFLCNEVRKRPRGLEKEAIYYLIYNYGSAYSEVLQYFESFADTEEQLTNPFAVVKAEVLHGIHEEMAQKLSDIVLRRTELGTAGYPGDKILKTCADIMSSELGWSSARTSREMQEVKEIFHLVNQ